MPWFLLLVAVLLVGNASVKSERDIIGGYYFPSSGLRVLSEEPRTFLAVNYCPTSSPSRGPTSSPSRGPTSSPSRWPTSYPSTYPTRGPTTQPSANPSRQPTAQPTRQPLNKPSRQPSKCPSRQPSSQPSRRPTGQPTGKPSRSPTSQPSRQPFNRPTSKPSRQPSARPTRLPTAQPSSMPSRQPSRRPSVQPTGQPSSRPSRRPSKQPSRRPSGQPSRRPSRQPSAQPSRQPTRQPSTRPTRQPSVQPSQPTSNPTLELKQIIIAIHKAVVTVNTLDWSVASVYVDMLPSRQTVTVSIYAISISDLPDAANVLYNNDDRALDAAVGSDDDIFAQQTAIATTRYSLLYDAFGNLKYTNEIVHRLIPVYHFTISQNSLPLESSARSLPLLLASQGVYLLVANVSVSTFQTHHNAFKGVPGQSEYGTPRIVGNALLIEAISPNVASLPQPRLVEGRFSDDGSKLLLVFDVATNLAKMYSQSSFSCGILFGFPGNTTSTCWWRDRSTVIAYTSQELHVNDTVTLENARQLGLRAACPASWKWEKRQCSARPSTFTRQAVLIRPPRNPIYPTVLISSINAASYCVDVVLDYSLSTGSGGRPWRSVKIQATLISASSASSQVASAAISLLNARLQGISGSAVPNQVIIPSDYLVANNSYGFTVRLCNHFMNCATAYKSIVVSDQAVTPLVTVDGPSFRVLNRSLPLLLSGSVAAASCNASVAVAKLSFGWKYYLLEGGYRPRLLKMNTSSFDRTRSVVAPLTFIAGDIIKAQFWATVVLSSTALGGSLHSVGKTTFSSSRDVLIEVVPSPLVPIIQGGTVSRVVKVSGFLVLNASTSYDPDVKPPISVNRNLKYIWECSQITPTFDGNCAGLKLDRVNRNTTSVVLVTASSNASIYQVFIVSVTVFDTGPTSKSYGNRAVKVSIHVSVVANRDPLVSLQLMTTSASEKDPLHRINPQDRIVLVGSVSSSKNSDILIGNCTWSLNDDASRAISDLTTMPTVNRVETTASISVTTFYLTILPYSLFPFHTPPLVFSFRCSLLVNTNYIYSGMAQVMVAVNEVPQPGVFVVTPREGIALVDTFTFNALQWFDVDLPLQYEFAYFTRLGDRVVIQPRADAVVGSFILPFGSPVVKRVRSSELNCVARIFDAVGSYHDAQYNVSILQNGFNFESSLAFLGTTLSTASTTRQINLLAQSTALAITVLGNVNCNNAPDCAALNRHSCAATANTCGPCISKDSYRGVDGDSNTLCLPLHQYEVSALAKFIKSNKQCPEDCSSNGICLFYNSRMKSKELQQCAFNDNDCEARCQCNVGYTGKSCSLTAAQLASKESLRALAALNIMQWMAASNNYSSHSYLHMNLYIDALHGLVSNAYDELSVNTSISIYNSAALILRRLQDIDTVAQSHLTTVAMSSSTIFIEDPISPAQKLLVILDNVAKAGMGSTNVSRLTLSMGNSMLLELVDQLTAIVAGSMVIGDQDISLVTDTFTTLNRVLPCAKFVKSLQQLRANSDSQDEFEVTAAQSMFDKFINKSTTSIRLPSIVSSDAITRASISNNVATAQFLIIAISIAATTISGSPWIASDPFLIRMEMADPFGDNFDIRLGSLFSSAANIIATVPTNYPLLTLHPIPSNITVKCIGGMKRVVRIVCDTNYRIMSPPSQLVVVSCNDSISTNVNVRCPYKIPTTVCRSLFGGSSLTNNGCLTLTTSATVTTCSCPFFKSATASPHSLNQRNPKALFVSAISSSPTLMPTYSEALRRTISFSFVAAQDTISQKALISYQPVVSVSSEKRGRIAFGVVISLCICVAIALFAGCQLDRRDRQLHRSVKAIIKTSLQLRKLAVRRRVIAPPPITSAEHVKNAKTKAPLIKTKQGAALGTKLIKSLRKAALGGIRKAKSPELIALDECLPKVFQLPSFSDRIAYELKCSHRWLSPFVHYSQFYPRILRMLSVINHIICVLFIDAIIYVALDPNDGSCNQQPNPSACAALLSPFKTREPKCSWNIANSTCSFIPPYESMLATVYVAGLATIVSAPMSVFVDWIITKILLAPVKPPPSNTFKAGTDGGPSKFTLYDIDGDDIFDYQTADLVDSQFEQDLQLMNVSLARHRALLESAVTFSPTSIRTIHRKRLLGFDQAWGLGIAGGDFSGSCISTMLSCRNIEDMWSCGSGRGPDISGRNHLMTAEIMDNLKHVVEATEFEKRFMAEYCVDDQLLSKRLLFLFQKELLPPVSSKIMELKSRRESSGEEPVYREKQLAAGVALVLVELGMLSFIFWFTIVQSNSNHVACLVSLVMWIITDLVVISTMVTIITHVIIPTMIATDVRVTKECLRQMLVEAQWKQQHLVQDRPASVHNDFGALDALQSRKGADNFNAARFLLVSYRMAHIYPENVISKLILRFKTTIPPNLFAYSTSLLAIHSEVSDGGSLQLATTAATYETSSTLKLPAEASDRNHLSSPTTLFLKRLTWFSASYQDLIILETTSVIVIYVLSLFLKLYVIYPALIILPPLFAIIVIHFAVLMVKYRQPKTTSKERGRKILPSRALLPQTELSTSAKVLPTAHDAQGGGSTNAPEIQQNQSRSNNDFVDHRPMESLGGSSAGVINSADELHYQLNEKKSESSLAAALSRAPSFVLSDPMEVKEPVQPSTANTDRLDHQHLNNINSPSRGNSRGRISASIVASLASRTAAERAKSVDGDNDDDSIDIGGGLGMISHRSFADISDDEYEPPRVPPSRIHPKNI